MVLLRERVARRGAGAIEPCLPSPAKCPPAGPGWIHEIKHDGFRIMARLDAKGVRLITRNGNDLKHRFPFVAMAVAALPATSCLIDGEAIACDENGLAVFDLIRGQKPLATAVHCAFDLVELDGEDLRRQPIERVSSGSLPCFAALIRRFVFNEHYEGDGAIIYKTHARSAARASCRSGAAAVQVRPLAALGEGEEPAAPAVTREAEEDWSWRPAEPRRADALPALPPQKRLSPRALAAFGSKPNIPIAAFVKRLRCARCGSGSVMANGSPRTKPLPPFCARFIQPHGRRRRFPPPWSVEERPACFIINDANGQAVAYAVSRGRVRPAHGRQAHDPRRGAAHRGEHRQVARPVVPRTGILAFSFVHHSIDEVGECGRRATCRAASDRAHDRARKTKRAIAPASSSDLARNVAVIEPLVAFGWLGPLSVFIMSIKVRRISPFGMSSGPIGSETSPPRKVARVRRRRRSPARPPPRLASQGHRDHPPWCSRCTPCFGRLQPAQSTRAGFGKSIVGRERPSLINIVRHLLTRALVDGRTAALLNEPQPGSVPE